MRLDDLVVQNKIKSKSRRGPSPPLPPCCSDLFCLPPLLALGKIFLDPNIHLH